MSWNVNVYVDKEKDEKLARLEFEVCEEDECVERLVDRFVHIVEDNN